MAAATVDLERLAKVPVATLTQVMQGMGRPRAFMEGIVPLDADAKIAGRARTLRFLPARVPAEEAAEILRALPHGHIDDKWRRLSARRARSGWSAFWIVCRRAGGRRVWR